MILRLMNVCHYWLDIPLYTSEIRHALQLNSHHWIFHWYVVGRERPSLVYHLSVQIADDT